MIVLLCRAERSRGCSHATWLVSGTVAVPCLVIGVGRVAAARQAGSGDADRGARVTERADRRRVLRSLWCLLRVVDGVHEVCGGDPHVACRAVVVNRGTQ